MILKWYNQPKRNKLRFAIFPIKVFDTYSENLAVIWLRFYEINLKTNRKEFCSFWC